MKKSNGFAIFSFILGLLFINLNLSAQEYKLVETGQADCYDADGNEINCPSEGEALYGQDAQYDSPTFSFTDNGDGTVTDENTGLMWQQTPTSNTFKWQQAVDYCDVLVLNDYDDWRMPTLKELFSISNFNSGWPYLDVDYFHLASGQVTKDEQYWCDNFYVGVTVEGGSEAAFGVNHVTGHIKAYPANAGGPVGGKYVRAVRGNAHGENDLIDNGDGTITDNSTGLMWTQADNGEGIDWENALTYAEGHELANHSDWRLPNVKELHSIVDYNYSPSATNEDHIGPAIDPMFDCTPIINEAGDNDYGYYWSSTSALFSSNQPYYYAWYVAFGMAVNGAGQDFHGAGGVRFDTKYEGGPQGEGGERYYNYVRLVRDVSTTGFNDQEIDNDSFEVYPNPAGDVITIDFSGKLAGNGTIQVLNLLGKIVYAETYEISARTLVNISELKPGVYFVKLQSEGQVYSRKLIKKR